MEERIEAMESLVSEVVDNAEMLENCHGDVDSVNIPIELYRQLIGWAEEL